MGLTLVTPATEAPITRDEVKVWARISADNTAFDAAIDMVIPGVVRQIEKYTAKTISEQVWELTLDGFCSVIDLPRGPVTAIDSFTYLDSNGTSRDVMASTYVLDLTCSPQRVLLEPNAAWPSYQNRLSVITIRFRTKMLDDMAAADMKQAMIMLAAYRFDHPEDGAIPEGIRDLLSSYRDLVI
ncbi:putative phiE125 gp8 family phage protein [Novosphingobium sp. SG751A]|uniref:head-tail connector protein n=1 Tax=Novosphingobium sp. SG751A TaxID=2587000 RepID=UPI001556E078|nr:hypothetical protein [Novosphingobium sp. SG751A]NOW44099.1 putative phiE125 gp8 family phage protein [Novosphingobium sp. SG751A]